MRLICPNCQAQYEVPDSVMPPDGRDVQCSNCGNQWFQEHPSSAQSSFDTPVPDSTEPETTAAEPEPAAEQAPVPEAKPQRPEPEQEPAPAEPKRRELDPAVADVLRAEAELEARARQQEGDLFEGQPELGLTESPSHQERRSREARDRMARLRGQDPVDDRLKSTRSNAAAVTSPETRRDLLPDIEEINSTLRSNSDRSPDVDPGQTAQIEVQERRSSRRGFTLSVLLIAVLALAYVFADDLSQAVPQAADALSAYTSFVDAIRDWISAQMASLLVWLDTTASGPTEG